MSIRGTNNMPILEEETYRGFGYHSSDWTPRSHKKIVIACDECGKARTVEKRQHRSLCFSCAMEKRSGENNHRWKPKVECRCEICGGKFKVNPSVILKGHGRFDSTNCANIWKSENTRGENSVHWKGGSSFEPYCQKFNNEFREYIRDKFGRICFLCSKTEEENGQRLSIHHVNGNKNCGCDEDATCQFVPLCLCCHSKIRSKKVDWEAKIRVKMQNKLNGWYI